MYFLRATSHFDRRIRRFRRAHPELKRRLEQIFRDLRDDPFQPHLRLHALSGELQGLHAVSVSYGYRIVLTLQIAEEEIILHDIGSHDEVYG